MKRSVLMLSVACLVSVAIPTTSAFAQVLFPCTRIDTGNRMNVTGQPGASATLDGSTVTDSPAYGDTMLATGSAQATIQAYGCTVTANQTGTASCATAQGSQSDILGVDMSGSTDANASAVSWHQGDARNNLSVFGSSQWRVDINPDYPTRTEGVIRGGFYFVGGPNAYGNFDTVQKILSGSCARSNLVAQGNAFGYTVTGTLQTLGGPVSIFQFHPGPIDELFEFEESVSVNDTFWTSGQVLINARAWSAGQPSALVWNLSETTGCVVDSGP